MPKDPVCLMDVDEKAEFKKELDNKIYYFCSKFCLEKFEKEPLASKLIYEYRRQSYLEI